MITTNTIVNHKKRKTNKTKVVEAAYECIQSKALNEHNGRKWSIAREVKAANCWHDDQTIVAYIVNMQHPGAYKSIVCVWLICQGEAIKKWLLKNCWNKKSKELNWRVDSKPQRRKRHREQCGARTVPTGSMQRRGVARNIGTGAHLHIHILLCAHTHTY